MPVVFDAVATTPEAKNPIKFNGDAMHEWLRTARATVKGDENHATPTGWDKLSDMMQGKGMFMLNDARNQATFVNPDSWEILISYWSRCVRSCRPA